MTMTSRWLRGLTLAAGLFVVACGDDETVPQGSISGSAGTSAGSAGQAGQGGAGSAGEAGSSGQSGGGSSGSSGQGVQGGQGGASGAGAAGEGGTGGAGCEVGAKVSQELGPDGGSLELCGARLSVAPGALNAAMLLGIEVVEPPIPAPFEREFLGPVVRFTPDDAPLPSVVTLALKRDPAATGIVDFATYSAQDNAWFGQEPCPEQDALTVKTGLLGTYTLLRDVNTYPPGPTGLGEGSFDGTFDGQPLALGTDQGYAIYEQGGATSRALTVVFRESTEQNLDNLDLRYALAEGQAPELVQVSWISTSDPLGGWSYLIPVDGPISTFSLTETSKDTFDGSLTVELRRGEEKRTLQGSFQIKAEKFRFPGEGICEPEG